VASARDIEAGRAFVRLFLKDDMASQLRRSLARASQSMKNFGASMMKIGAGITAPLSLAVREFATFDAAMGQVSTMLDEPQSFMPGFTEGVKGLAEEFGKTKDELATGLYDILSATVPPEQAMQRLAAATKLAAAGNAEVGASVSVLNTLMDTYGDSFQDAGDASDFLFAIVKRGRTNLSELSGSLGDILAAAKAAGMSVEDMGASVALLTRATGKTDSALTALQAISGTFLKPGTEGARIWEKEFGDAMDAATLKSIGMAGVLERLSRLDPGKVAKIFPNLRAIRGIFPAINKMEGFGDDLKGMASRAGNVDAAFNKGAGPLREWQKLMQQLSNFMEDVGEAIANAIMPHIDTIKQIVGAVTSWVNSNKKLVVVVAAVGAGLLAAGAVLYTFGTILGGVATAINAVKVALTFLAAHPIVAVFAGIGAGLIAVQMLTKHTADLSRAMADAREEGDKQRRADQDKMARLSQLAQQESRTNREMETAKQIVAELTKRYGDLGIVVNETTGAITGMATAQANLNAAQVKAAKQQLKKEIFERQTNIDELIQEMRNPGWLRAAGEGLGAVSADARINDVMARIQAEQTALDALLPRYKQLAENDIAGATGSAAEPAAGSAAGPAAGSAAGPAAEEPDASLRRALLAEMQLIEDEEARALAIEKLHHEARVKEAKAAGHDLANVEREYQANVTRIRRDAEERRKDAEEREREQRLSAEERLRDEIARLEIETTKKGREEELALLDLEESQALREAAETGADPALIRRKFELRRQQIEPEAVGVPRGSALTATYSAAAAQIAGYYGKGPEKEMADGIKQLVSLGRSQYEALQEFLAGWRVA
jgi:TP901 family phage tail tape measure protein